ncbi:hypothetical protein BX600DRAFT_505510 [Xylariales sp. PMI_506]|nr:hypothetical protein BX600DRAFT_505510 [Xylariales sp. PMI_506]
MSQHHGKTLKRREGRLSLRQSQDYAVDRSSSLIQSGSPTPRNSVTTAAPPLSPQIHLGPPAVIPASLPIPIGSGICTVSVHGFAHPEIPLLPREPRITHGVPCTCGDADAVVMCVWLSHWVRWNTHRVLAPDLRFNTDLFNRVFYGVSMPLCESYAQTWNLPAADSRAYKLRTEVTRQAVRRSWERLRLAPEGWIDWTPERPLKGAGLPATYAPLAFQPHRIG